MTDQEFADLSDFALQYMKQPAPRKTGNLEDNAMRLEMYSPQVAVIYVDEAIAPYMPYTNEPWISPRWKGKKNPNEEWWNYDCEITIKKIADRLGGELRRL